MTADGRGGEVSPIEVELKFRMTDAAPGERLIALDTLAGFVAAEPAREVVADDRYLDTPGGLLGSAGYACRLRASGGGTRITLKGLRRLDDGGVVHRREELDGPADPSTPPASWPASKARDAVIEIAGDEPLGDLVTIHQVRRKRDYRRDDTVVELSVDGVEVIAGGEVVERFAELELELVEGDEAGLQPLVDLLADIEELLPATTSKLERALEAVRRSPWPGEPERGTGATVAAEVVADVPEPKLAVARTPGTLADDHVAEAGRKVLRFHLARMIAREPGTRTGTDAEELHGMRVATRRQRAAWRVFGDAFDPERTARHRRKLRDLAGLLGTVRDLDVLIEAAEAYRDRQAPDEAAAFDRLPRTWRRQRDAGRVLLLKELDSARHQRWVDDYVAFVQTEGLGVRPVAPTAPHRVRDTMPSRIWTAYEAVRAYEPVLRWADVTTLHDLRIASKWLRYTVEFVREPLGPDAGPVIERIVVLQDHLGWLNDADVSSGLARQFLGQHAGDVTEREGAAIGRYLLDREHELARLRRTVGAPWRGVASPAFRRALGRLVAGL